MASVTLSPSATTVDRGDIVRCTATFLNDAGAAGDPGTVRFRHQDPSENETLFTYPTGVTKTGTGVYYIEITTDEPGWWSVRVEGTTTVTAADGTGFRVLLDDFYTPA